MVEIQTLSPAWLCHCVPMACSGKSSQIAHHPSLAMVMLLPGGDPGPILTAMP